MIDESFYVNIRTALNNFFGNFNMNPVMPQIRNLMEWAIQEQFLTEGRYFGGRLGSVSFGYKWFDLAESTKESRAKRGYWPGSILQQTAVLVGSASASSSGNQITAGVDMGYARYLHYGTNQMPPRPIIPHAGLPQDLLQMIADEVGRYIQRTTK